MERIKIYVAHKMTGKMQDELVREAEYTTRTLTNYGFDILDPIIEEGVKDVHEPLVQVSSDQLERYWRRDKIMIKEADLVLDFQSCNTSDGVNKEIGYARFCLWKPVVRVFPKCGINISRIEDDAVVETLPDAIAFIQEHYGDYEKLRVWRQIMLNRSLEGWMAEQAKMNDRYGVKYQEVASVE